MCLGVPECEYHQRGGKKEQPRKIFDLHMSVVTTRASHGVDFGMDHLSKEMMVVF